MAIEVYVEQFRQVLESLDDNGMKRPEFAIAIVQEMAKDRRMDEIAVERRNNEERATEKQLAFLKNLGIQFGKGLTKGEASKLIDEALGKG